MKCIVGVPVLICLLFVYFAFVRALEFSDYWAVLCKAAFSHLHRSHFMAKLVAHWQARLFAFVLWVWQKDVMGSNSFQEWQGSCEPPQGASGPCSATCCSCEKACDFSSASDGPLGLSFSTQINFTLLGMLYHRRWRCQSLKIHS